MNIQFAEDAKDCSPEDTILKVSSASCCDELFAWMYDVQEYQIPSKSPIAL